MRAQSLKSILTKTVRALLASETIPYILNGKLEYEYDYTGRCVVKKVYSFSKGKRMDAEQASQVCLQRLWTDRRTGWHQHDAVLKMSIWGKGKILVDIHGSNVYYALYALGNANKNITEYLDSSENIHAH